MSLSYVDGLREHVRILEGEVKAQAERIAELEAEVRLQQRSARISLEEAERHEQRVAELEAEVKQLRVDLNDACNACGSDDPELAKQCPRARYRREAFEEAASMARNLEPDADIWDDALGGFDLACDTIADALEAKAKEADS